MNRLTLILILFSLLLAGCSTLPVTTKFPELPSELSVLCSELSQIQNETKLSDVTKSVVENYSKYHSCRNRHEATVNWYKEQKKIFESVKSN